MKNYFEFRCCNSASVEHFRYEVWNGAGFAGSAVCVAEVFHIVPDGDTGCGDVLVVVGLAEKNEFSRFLKRAKENKVQLPYPWTLLAEQLKYMRSYRNVLKARIDIERISLEE